jgi:small subunit ribosomal protein S20
MAHHLSAKKRIRHLRNTKEKDTAAEKLPKVSSMLDRLAKMNIIHRNKAANLKSKLAKHVNSL